MLKTFQSDPLNIGRWAYRLTGRTIEQLARKNYYTARAYYHYKLRRADRRYEELPLLIHQMGKVGSGSVHTSLKMAKIGWNVYHTHFLASELVDKYEEKRRKYLGTEREGALKHIWQYQHLRKKIKHGLNGKKWKIITLVRDPIARNLSDFFEHIEVLPSESDQQWKLKSIEYDYEITIINNNLEELIELFFERYNHDVAMSYFDRELKGIFNIDLFDSNFPTSKGYKIYREKEADADVLLIRLENLNDCFTEAIKEFLSVDNLTMVLRHVGSEKEYADIYQMFKDTICLPESYIDKIYSSKFARHFYSKAEIEQFRAKWSS